MLSQLYIENIAVIQKATIQLDHGFNVFTGETGAGKTILISAINAVLGALYCEPGSSDSGLWDNNRDTESPPSTGSWHPPCQR